MTMPIWRISTDTPDYFADDLSGIGAKITGGRWNRQDTPMLYCGSNTSVACLETMVHLSTRGLPLNRYLVQVDIPTKIWDAAQILTAPPIGWDALPAGRVSLDYGTSWCKSKSSALLLVPSTVVQEEYNVLINPEHDDVKQITAIKLRRWTYDSRIWR